LARFQRILARMGAAGARAVIYRRADVCRPAQRPRHPCHPRDRPNRRRGDHLSAVCGITGRLAMSTGIFNLLWVSVTILMIVRPGSTTGV
jgi:hypothetical protein